MPTPDVSVIVPSWGAPPTVPALLSALRAQTLAPDRFEILIVDAGVAGGPSMLARLSEGWAGPRLRIVPGPLPGGPAARRNHGAKLADGEVLAFTDTDCEPEPAWLEAGLATGAEMAQGATLPPNGGDLPPRAHFICIDRESFLYETSNMFYERAMFERLGGFTTRYFDRLQEPFGEDTELGWRARRAGARFRFEPAAVVRHAVTPRSLAPYLRYAWRGRAFPWLVGDVPELRRSFMYRGLFLSGRTARFDLALLGLALAKRHPWSALLTIPYLRALAGAPEPMVEAAFDAVLCAGLATGSVHRRRPVL